MFREQKIIKVLFLAYLAFLFVCNELSASDKTKSYVLTWEDLIELKVTSASLKEEDPTIAPLNITIVTKEMIENRGYRTFVEVAQDLPGFDFLMFEEGGGEFSTFSRHRGIGGKGNPQMLVMIDNIPQNYISNLWSVHWTFEQMLHDLDRIEVIQGPGSALYGGQAFTGVIHFITKKNYEGIYAKAAYGINNEIDIQGLIGKKINDDLNFSLSFRKYHTDGDFGNNRPDPGKLWHDITGPENPNALPPGAGTGSGIGPGSGQLPGSGPGTRPNVPPNPLPPLLNDIPYPDGISNWIDAQTIRFKLTGKNSETGIFYWEQEKAAASFFLGGPRYSYDNKQGFGMRGINIYSNNTHQISKKLFLESNLVTRGVWHLPVETDTSINQVNLTSISGYQAYLNEKLRVDISDNNNIIIGGRFLFNFNLLSTETISEMVSFSANQAASALTLKPEVAAYALWNNTLNKYISYSVGTRVDYGRELSFVNSPRATLIVMPSPKLNFKLLYGHAFRQPDLTSALSAINSQSQGGNGSSGLKSETTKTSELEINIMPEKRFRIKTNIFYSKLDGLIGFVTDSLFFMGERATNIDEFSIYGASINALYSPVENIRFYSNYMFTQGKDQDEDWNDIEKVASHKLNIGVNCLLFDKKLNVNARANIVGKRKANENNSWLHLNENGYAPAYKKLNLTVTYNGFKRFQPQLIVRNLLNEQYYGVGRNTGYNGRFDEDANLSMQNIPSYHPQPGRTITLLLKFEI